MSIQHACVHIVPDLVREQCPKATDGRNQIDLESIDGGNQAEPHAVWVSMTCALCDQSGDVQVDEEMVVWDGPDDR